VRPVSGSAVVESTERMLSHLGLAWREGGAPRVRVRDGAGWQEWTVPSSCTGGRDDGDRWAGAATLVTPEVTGYEIRGVGETLVQEIDATGGPLRPRDPRERHSDTMLGYRLRHGYRNRASWGADESLRFAADGTNRCPDAYYPVQALTVHHSVTRTKDPDPAATVRSIYFDQTITRNFGDLGYHLLIDGAGTVYEGRSSGSDGEPVFGGTALAQMNNAAHVAGYNAGNVGVALLGDFTDVAPGRAAVNSLIKVLAILSAVCNLDPTGRTAYVNPISGAARNVRTISGHLDWAATECPGDLLYPLLPNIRRQVARRRSSIKV